MPYIGNDLATQFQAFATQTITGDGSTGYTLDRAVANGKELLVYINNVKQEEGSGKSYTATGTTITFSAAVASTDSCYVVFLGSAIQTINPPDASVGSAQITNATLVMPNKIDMNGNELILDADADTSITADTDDQIDFKTGGSDRVVIDSSGNVILNATSQSGTSNKLCVKTDNKFGVSIIDTTAQAADVGGALNLGGNYRSAADAQAFTRIEAKKVNGTDNDYGYNMAFSTTPNSGTFTERMRIDSSGNVLVGTTSTTPNPGISLDPTGNLGIGNSSGNSGNSFLEFRRSATQIGGVTQSGTTGVAFNTSSDYRLKENVVTDWDATTRLKQLKPSRCNFIADADTTVDGFLAHEVSSIVPEAITGDKDAMTKEVLYVDGDEIPEGKKVGDVKTPSQIDPQGIDHSKLVPLLTKALQEAISEIDTLKEKVTALESK